MSGFEPRELALTIYHRLSHPSLFIILEVQRYITVKMSINNNARPVFEAFKKFGLAGVREDNISLNEFS
jgi:hypothetical protein